MPGKKARQAKQRERILERQKTNWKKHRYHQMSKNGNIGTKELEKYSLMYESLNGQRNYFPSPSENPTRKDYDRIRSAYHSLDSKL